MRQRRRRGRRWGKQIALLLPETKTAGYEAHDRPSFEAKVKQLCPDCELLYSNASQDATKQQAQAEAAITKGADALVLDAVDAKSAVPIIERAKQADIPVIAYDRLISGTDIDYYVSFDNVRQGRIQAKSLLAGLGSAADGKSIVMINGSPTDPSAGDYKKGAHQVLDSSGATIAKEYDTPDWSPDKAQREMEQALTAVGQDEVAGVYSANDGMAGGAIAALKGVGLSPADVAAQLAVAAAKGEDPPAGLVNAKVDNGSGKVASVLLTPVAVTKDNMADTVIKDGFYKPSEICTGELEQQCKAAGIE